MVKNKIEGIDKQQWQALAKSSKTCTWFQTYGAYQFYSNIDDLVQPFVYAVENEGQLRGVIVGYITREKNQLKNLLTRRAIIIGGPLLANDITDEELRTLLTAVREDIAHRAIYIETRNFHDFSEWKSVYEACGFTYKPHYNFKVDCSSQEVIEKNIDRGRRRNVNSSLKLGCEMVEHPTIEQVREWYLILQDLYRTKVKTPLFPLSFFEKLYTQSDCRYFLVSYQGRILGGTACVLVDQREIYEWFGCGLDYEIKGVTPSVLSTYQGLLYGSENGIPVLDMMGAGSPDDDYGVRKFKERFGGQLVEHGRFLCITKPLLYHIGALGVKILKKVK